MVTASKEREERGNVSRPAAQKAEFLEFVPALRAFALSLSGSHDRADDLVQETLVRAWGSFDSFSEGTNLKAWLVTILRNVYYAEYRKRKVETVDLDGFAAEKLSIPAAQNDHMDLRDVYAALRRLTPDQREAIILVGASGFSYEEAAAICQCSVGTMKSRVSRGRERLLSLLI